ncbi:MAG: hypothetical protein QW291_01465 [Thermofilaceae archaeon]
MKATKAVKNHMSVTSAGANMLIVKARMRVHATSKALLLVIPSHAFLARMVKIFAMDRRIN